MDRSAIYTELGLYLYTEEKARLGTGGEMLPPAAVPDDGLCRVIVDHHSHDAPLRSLDEWEEAVRRPFRYPTMVALACASLAGENGRLWCVGEVRLIEVETLEELHGRKVARVPDTRHSSRLAPDGRTVPAHIVDFIVFSIPACDVTSTTFWPGFGGTESPRIFAFRQAGTPLERDLQRLESAMMADRAEALLRWDAINDASFERAGVLAFCDEAVVAVVPDGPHGNQAAIYSRHLDLHTIVGALGSVARQAGLACVVIPNVGDQYRMLHP